MAIYLGTTNAGPFKVISSKGGGSRLPAELQEVEYLESSGTQYINTRYIHNEHTKISVDCLVKKNSKTPYAAIFGARKGSYVSNAMVFFVRFGTQSGFVPCYNRSGAETEGTSIDMIYDSRITLVCHDRLATWTDGVNTHSLTTIGTIDSGYNPLLIFNLNTSSGTGVVADTSPSNLKLYNFVIEDNNVQSRNFVPCYVKAGQTYEDVKGNVCSAGKCGLYDFVNDKFYTNDGSGEFIVGADVNARVDSVFSIALGAGPEPEFPAELQKVEYLESSGTQYIDTGFNISHDDKITLDLQFLDNTPESAHGCTGPTGNYPSEFRVFSNKSWGQNKFNNPKANASHGSSYVLFIQNNDTARHVWSLDGSNGQVKFDQKTLLMSAFDWTQTTSSFVLFARKTKLQNADSWFIDSYVVGRIYSALFSNEEDVLHNYIPCYVKTGKTFVDVDGNTQQAGKPGLYDMVNHQFYVNKGTYEFIAGPDIN